MGFTACGDEPWEPLNELITPVCLKQVTVMLNIHIPIRSVRSAVQRYSRLYKSRRNKSEGSAQAKEKNSIPANQDAQATKATGDVRDQTRLDIRFPSWNRASWCYRAVRSLNTRTNAFVCSRYPRVPNAFGRFHSAICDTDLFRVVNLVWPASGALTRNPHVLHPRALQIFDYKDPLRNWFPMVRPRLT